MNEEITQIAKKFGGTVPRVKRDIVLEREMTVKEVRLQQFLNHGTRLQGRSRAPAMIQEANLWINPKHVEHRMVNIRRSDRTILRNLT